MSPSPQKKITALVRATSAFCLSLLFASEGYTMQPPPPPLDILQLSVLVSEADLIVVGKINEVKEIEQAGSVKTVLVTMHIEKILKGKVPNKKILIKETYRLFAEESAKKETQSRVSSSKNIVSAIAGPSAYHGSYKAGQRIVVLLNIMPRTDDYKPLGSGTYDKHFGEFLIENNQIVTLYFNFAEDMKQYASSEKIFVCFIKKIVRSK